MIPQKTKAIARIAKILKGYPGLMQVRCPFCDDIHEHGVSSAEALLGVPVHRSAHCWCLDDAHLHRGRRRRQLEEGKARHDEASGCYFIPQFVSLYVRYQRGKLVEIHVGELRK